MIPGKYLWVLKLGLFCFRKKKNIQYALKPDLEIKE